MFLSYLSFLLGGIGLFVIDVILYTIVFFLYYSVVFFTKVSDVSKTRKIIYIGSLLILMIPYTYSMNKYLLLLLVPLMIHLFTGKKVDNLDLNAIFFKSIIKYMPISNKVVVCVYMVAAIISTLLLHKMGIITFHSIC